MISFENNKFCGIAKIYDTLLKIVKNVEFPLKCPQKSPKLCKSVWKFRKSVIPSEIAKDL